MKTGRAARPADHTRGVGHCLQNGPLTPPILGSLCGPRAELGPLTDVIRKRVTPP